MNRIYDIVGQTTDRYNGLVSSARDFKYMLIWKLNHEKKRVVTKMCDDKLHEEQALYCIITVKLLFFCLFKKKVLKSLAKCYRLKEIMR